MASYRSHGNLQMHLARLAISWMRGEDAQSLFAEQRSLIASDNAALRLLLAYRCHLADLCSQQNISMRPLSAMAALDKLGPVVPELAELAEKEQRLEWLEALLALHLDQAPEMEHNTLASDALISVNKSGVDWSDANALTFIADELQSIFNRQREAQLEY